MRNSLTRLERLNSHPDPSRNTNQSLMNKDERNRALEGIKDLLTHLANDDLARPIRKVIAGRIMRLLRNLDDFGRVYEQVKHGST